MGRRGSSSSNWAAGLLAIALAAVVVRAPVAPAATAPATSVSPWPSFVAAVHVDFLGTLPSGPFDQKWEDLLATGKVTIPDFVAAVAASQASAQYQVVNTYLDVLDRAGARPALQPGHRALNAT